ncbi:MAG: isoprenylcysteine carboxylmethyltransferase family protein [Flavobacteriales bacterium]|nr:isoprenylcysteine carboxylmethyltransferase family protein [Flavobacteriales bacterium]
MMLALSLLVFYALHSLLALTGVKEWAARRLALDRWYRLGYSLVSMALLAWVVCAYVEANRQALWTGTPVMVVPGATLILLGGALSTVAVLRFGGGSFLGFFPEKQTGLVRTGLHGKVRHPIYSGMIIAAIGWSVLSPTVATFIVVGITFVYLPIGIHLEERKLIAKHGDAYRQYKAKVPTLFPKPW